MFRKGGKRAAKVPAHKSNAAGKDNRNEAQQDKKRKAAAAALVSPPATTTRRRLTKAEARGAGKIHIAEEQFRACFLTCCQERFNEPLEEDWPDLVREIQKEVGGHRDTMRRVWKEARDGNTECALRNEGGGHPRKLEPNNEGLSAAALALNTGVSPALASQTCNTVNAPHGVDAAIARKTSIDALEACTDIQMCEIQRRKTGSKDKNSGWAKTRKRFCEQLRDMLDCGQHIDQGVMTFEECHHSQITPWWVDGCLWVDQKHDNCVIGGSGHSGTSGNVQWRMAIDPQTGSLLPVSKGGKVPQKRERVQPKCDAQSKATFGAACPIDNDGVEEPQMMRPWNCTGKKLVSVKGADAICKRISERCSDWGDVDKKGWEPHQGKRHPFLLRHGEENFRAEVRKVPAWKPHAPVTDMADHVVAEGERMFNNTRHKDNWLCCHDHLKIFWERQTVDCLKSLKCPIGWNPERTWCDRFIHLHGHCNIGLPTTFMNTLPGDLPEMVPLDCHLFADLIEANSYNTAFSHLLPEGHPAKCSSSTPNRMRNSLLKTIAAGVPTPARIKEDICRIANTTIQRIIDADGCCVEHAGKKGRKGNRGDAQRDEKTKLAERFQTIDSGLVESVIGLHADIKAKRVQCPFVLEEQAAEDMPDKEISVDVDGDDCSVGVGSDD